MEPVPHPDYINCHMLCQLPYTNFYSIHKKTEAVLYILHNLCLNHSNFIILPYNRFIVVSP